MKKRGKKGGTKKGYKTPYTLSRKQTEVLRLLTVDYMTPKMIANHYKTTIWAVYKIIKKLKEKGALKGGPIRGYKNMGVPAPKSSIRYFRLHGLQLSIMALILSDKYRKHIKKTTILKINGFNVIMYPTGNIQIYQAVGHSFNGETTDITMKRAMEYMNRIINKIENDWNIIIIKDRKCNIKVVNGHLAEVENGYAKYVIDDLKTKITIYGSDGIAWAKADTSGGKEFETVHPALFKPDQDIMQKYFNDFREKEPPTNSEMYNLVEKHMKAMDDMVTQFRAEMDRHMELIGMMKDILMELKNKK